MDARTNTEADLRDKTLLIITPAYPNEDGSYVNGIFVKNQVGELKRNFEKIVIIAPVLRSFGYLDADRSCQDYSYDNVEVHFPRSTYVPIAWSRVLIDTRLKVVERTIEQNHIDFDLVHAHFTWPSSYIGVMLKSKYGRPVITTIHENGTWLHKEIALDHPLLNRAWSEADALIRVNSTDVPLLQNYNERVYAVPNGFSPSFHPVDTASAREQIGIPPDAQVIFTLGMLIKRKGFNFLIEAMEKIGGRRDDVLCYIGGGGPEGKNLQRQIDRADLGGKVKLLGSVPGDQLNLWMNACDIFALPSLSEGNPTVMFECLGCGKPFLGTRVGGVPEVITSDAYGLTCEPGNAGDLAEKLTRALGMRWDPQSTIAYSGQFTWENISKQILQVYLSVLNEGSRRPSM